MLFASPHTSTYLASSLCVTTAQACCDLIAKVADSPAFQELRAKQQLGYYVSFQSRVFSGVPFIIVAVRLGTGFVSPHCFLKDSPLAEISHRELFSCVLAQVESSGQKFTVETVFERIEQFLTSFFETELKVMPEATFVEHRSACILRKLRPADNLEADADRHWQHIHSGFLLFPSLGENTADADAFAPCQLFSFRLAACVCDGKVVPFAFKPRKMRLRSWRP